MNNFKTDDRVIIKLSKRYKGVIVDFKNNTGIKPFYMVNVKEINNMTFNIEDISLIELDELPKR